MREIRTKTGIIFTLLVSDGRPERPDAASGGAVSNGEQPPGNPSESMKSDGEAPNGKNGNDTENDNQSSK